MIQKVNKQKYCTHISLKTQDKQRWINLFIARLIRAFKYTMCLVNLQEIEKYMLSVSNLFDHTLLFQHPVKPELLEAYFEEHCIELLKANLLFLISPK